jgi:uncharacterized protein (DUF1015 family)
VVSVAEIRPLRGVHYNQALLKDWSSVICPVYDIISPQQQQELYQRSEYNFVRLEFGRDLPQDTATDNKYTRAAATLERWLRQGILVTDDKPAIYLYDQFFTHQGRECQRRSLTVRVRVEEWDRMVVRPHESTMAEPKTDRLSLLWAIQANTSPILALYEDRDRQIATLLDDQARGKPLIDLKSVSGDGHRVWAITESRAINQITTSLADQPLYIADGHHRYESALTYRRQRRAAGPPTSPDAPYNFVMMTLVDFVDPGLLILPPHRLVRGIPKSTLGELRAKLEVFFGIEEWPLKTSGVWARLDELPKGKNEKRLVLFGLDTENLYLLRLPDPAAVSQMMPYFHSELYKKLDVSITDHVLLEEFLALSRDQEKTSLAYSYDRQEAVNRVLNQEYQLAFLLNPIEPQTVKAIADVGDKMPRKSTYFYPKLPAGLIVNRLI